MSPPNEPPRPPKPPPPAPETLQGIGTGIREILVKQEEIKREQKAHSDTLGRVEEKLIVHGHRIGQVERQLERHGDILEEHGDRLIELERLPRARPPHPSGPMLDELEDDDDELEQTSPGVRRITERRHAATERTINDLRERLDSMDRAREFEQERAKGAEQERERIAREAEAEKTRLEKSRLADNKEWDRRLKNTKTVAGIIIAVGTIVFAVLRFLHL